MSATKKQRFTLYLLTLLFIWVNSIAAPYQCIQNASTKSETQIVSVFEAPVAHIQNNLLVPDEASFNHPIDYGDRGIHSAYPAEETFEEQEEAERRDELGFIYVMLPEYLKLSLIASNLRPLPIAPYSYFSAVRKQSTYLLDCTFLI